MLSISSFIDRTFATLTGLQELYGDGWGEPRLLEQLLGRIAHFDDPKPIDVHFSPGRRTWRGNHLYEGWFESPDMSLPLPAESRTAYFQLLLPPDPFDPNPPPLCIHLAGTGDTSYASRRRLAAPLAKKRGIAALILQNPYYGERRPNDQFWVALKEFTDQLTMNIATVEETRSLMQWFREDGYDRLGVTGYSMGGIMAAVAAQVAPFQVAAIPCAAGDSPAPTMLDSPLQDIVDWEALAADADGSIDPRTRLRELLDRLAVSHVGDPPETDSAIVLGAENDAFIPPAEVEQLHHHWKGSELRWLDASHITGWTLHPGAIRDAIADAFDRLENSQTSNRGTE
ncbi:MAG: alpha/beta hydrolase family protein [Bradymonadaceae bacterium]